MPMTMRIRRRLKLRELDVLLAVAQCRTMLKAAQQLAMSQPAVSKAVADLEDTLGVRLFDRSSRGVEPTLFGVALLKWASAVFDDIAQGVNEIDFLASPGAGLVRVAAAPQIIAGILPVVLASLKRDYPRITFNISTAGDAAHQYRELRDRNVDLVVSRIHATDNFKNEIHTDVIFDDPIFLVAGANNPLVRRRRILLKDIAGEAWTLPPSNQSVTGLFFDKMFRSQGVEPPEYAVTCRSIEMHTSLLCSGPFLSIYPLSVLKFGHGLSSLKVLPFEVPMQPDPVGILTWKRRTISPVCKLFIQRFRTLSEHLTKEAKKTAKLPRDARPPLLGERQRRRNGAPQP
jgi:DNA-binding transcriptional LysR family regulator